MTHTALALCLVGTISLCPAGCTTDSADPDSGHTSPSPVQTTPTTPASPKSTIDPCLIGRWRQVSMQQTMTFDKKRVVATGWTGRTLNFGPSGIEIVSFDAATPITAPKAPRGAYRETYKGQAVYHVSTRVGVLRFESVDFGRTRVRWQYGSRRGVYTPDNVPPGPVEYTCGEKTHTQKNANYRATFTRLLQ